MPCARGRLPLTLSTLCFAAPALAGPNWIEVGDAGSSLLTAQRPTLPPGVTELQTISGNLDPTAADFEDLYIIDISQPVMFSMTTGISTFNPVLYMFNITVNDEAFGLLANDDQAAGNPIPRLLPAATDGTGAMINEPGLYLIAITGAGRFPLSSTGAIFIFANATEISGADGPGGINPHAGWAGEGETGSYSILFTGVHPAPGTIALPALLGAALLRRRR